MNILEKMDKLIKEESKRIDLQCPTCGHKKTLKTIYGAEPSPAQYEEFVKRDESLYCPVLKKSVYNSPRLGMSVVKFSSGGIWNGIEQTTCQHYTKG